MEQVELIIEGMHCAGCVSRIEQRLKAEPGVVAAVVNLVAGKAAVTYHAAQTNPAVLVAKINSWGYRARTGGWQSSSGRQENPWLKPLVVSAACSSPLLLRMVLHVFGHNGPVLSLFNPYIECGLATIVQIYGGWPFYRKAWLAVWTAVADMNVLVSLGSSAAYLLSVYNLCQGDAGSLYFESSAVLLTFVLLGKYIEDKAVVATGDAVRGLLVLQVRQASVITAGGELLKPIEEVVPGDIVLVRQGEKIPVDGEVVEGISEVDQSLLTGESGLVAKRPGDGVWAGTLNIAGSLKVRSDREAGQTLLSQIVRLVEQAQTDKPPVQRLTDRVAGYFSWLVIILAALTFWAWGWWWGGQDWQLAAVCAASVLVVSCPCALGLATPLAVVGGLGRAARTGLLFKKASAIETLVQVDTVVLDKTGTITAGRPVVESFFVTERFANEADRVIALAAAAEFQSPHPLAAAVVSYANARGLTLPAPDYYQMIVGAGVEARFGTTVVRVGKSSWLGENGPELVVEVDGQVAARIKVGDEIRRGARELIARLTDRNIRVRILTGDNCENARMICQQLDIPAESVISDCLPADKAKWLAGARAEGAVVMMVGDGINDAPALATADIGVSLAEGSQIAINAGDIIIINGDLSLVAEAIDIAGRVMGNIRLSLFWAFIYNLIAIPVAMLGMLTPLIAGAAMALSSVSVVMNARRVAGR
ncbi:MAG: heavy metal translocating P-type ATPase [Negativicutes bacterium]|nr:heavy metal translocating P-type ATPase [Negativicutes bacterium]